MNKLALNIDKTKVMKIATSQRLLRDRNDLQVFVDGSKVDNVTCMKCLGVQIDQNLKFHEHVQYNFKKVSQMLGMLRKNKQFLTEEQLNQIYKSFILPHFLYSSTVWSQFSITDTNKLTSLQKRCGRIISNVSHDADIRLVFDDLQWQFLESLFIKQRNTMMYKCINGLVPDYLSNEFKFAQRSYEFRQSTLNLALPRCNTESFRKSFIFRGVQSWNNLPHNVKNATSLKQFKRLCL